MSSVLGVSVGASAVRLVHPDTSDRQGNRFLSQPVVTTGRPEESAAESIGVVLTGDASPGRVQQAGVAYRDEVQAGAVHAAMARQQLRNYELFPEIDATMRALEHSGILGKAQTPLVYDLGSSGLTVSVVDRASGDVLETQRTTIVGGDLFDRLVRDNQVSAERLRAPRTEAESHALDAQCRAAKEQLSRSGAVCVPGDSGLLLLSRDVFESLVTVPVESSARLVRDVVTRASRCPDIVVLVGGGAHVPLVRSVIESWIALPTVVPESPELVAARGAALLVGSRVKAVKAQKLENPTSGDASGADPEPDWAALLADPAPRSKSVRGRAAVVASLGALCFLGIGVAVGAAMIPNRTVGEAVPAAPSETAPPTTTVLPPPPPPPSSVPPPPPEPVEIAPVQPRQQPTVRIPDPEPPPPPPGPTIPGLPPIQLPPLQLPEFPRLPG